jgi:hypothetical protein
MCFVEYTAGWCPVILAKCAPKDDANSTSRGINQWRETCVSSEAYVGDTSLHTALQPRASPRTKCISSCSSGVELPVIDTGLQSNYCIERIAFDCTYKSLKMNAQYHMLVYVVNSLSV